MGDSQRTRRLSRSRATRTRAGRTSRAAAPERAERRRDAGATDLDSRSGGDRDDRVRRLTSLDTNLDADPDEPEGDDRAEPDPDPIAAEDADAAGHTEPAGDTEPARHADRPRRARTARHAEDADVETVDETAVGDDDPAAQDRDGDTPSAGAGSPPTPDGATPEGAGSDSGDPPAAGTGEPAAAAGTSPQAAPAAADLPVRQPGSRRVGRRRAVGPVIGDQLATELLAEHRQDVLLSDRCSCGEPFPCRSRAFATCFVLEKSYPPPDLEMPYRIVPPELRLQGPRHAAAAGEPVVAGASRPVDVDATVQFAKIPAEPPVAVAS